jgi:hypothetical protein
MAMKTGYDCFVRTSLATFFKSFMNAAICVCLAVSSGARRIDDGCTVAVAYGAS